MAVTAFRTKYNVFRENADRCFRRRCRERPTENSVGRRYGGRKKACQDTFSPARKSSQSWIPRYPAPDDGKNSGAHRNKQGNSRRSDRPPVFRKSIQIGFIISWNREVGNCPRPPTARFSKKFFNILHTYCILHTARLPLGLAGGGFQKKDGSLSFFNRLPPESTGGNSAPGFEKTAEIGLAGKP